MKYLNSLLNFTIATDVFIVLFFSLLISTIIYYIQERFKPKILIDLGRSIWIIK